jgi:hypothetical protein
VRGRAVRLWLLRCGLRHLLHRLRRRLAAGLRRGAAAAECRERGGHGARRAVRMRSGQEEQRWQRQCGRAGCAGPRRGECGAGAMEARRLLRPMWSAAAASQRSRPRTPRARRRATKPSPPPRASSCPAPRRRSQARIAAHPACLRTSRTHSPCPRRALSPRSLAHRSRAPPRRCAACATPAAAAHTTSPRAVSLPSRCVRLEAVGVARMPGADAAHPAAAGKGPAPREGGLGAHVVLGHVGRHGPRNCAAVVQARHEVSRARQTRAERQEQGQRGA